MQIDKAQIIELLKSQGNHDQAAQAHEQLPDTVDTDRHGDLLGKLGIDPAQLLGSMGGIGGIAGKLGL